MTKAFKSVRHPADPEPRNSPTHRRNASKPPVSNRKPPPPQTQTAEHQPKTPKPQTHPTQPQLSTRKASSSLSLQRPGVAAWRRILWRTGGDGRMRAVISCGLHVRAPARSSKMQYECVGGTRIISFRSLGFRFFVRVLPLGDLGFRLQGACEELRVRGSV